MAAHHVEKIHHAAVLQAARYLQSVSGGEAAGQVFVAGVTHADDECRPDAFAHRPQHVEAKAQAVVQRTAIGFVQRICEGRPELVHQVAVGLQLQAIEPGRLHAFGGVGIVADDAFDVPVFQLLRKGTVRGLALV